jgi:small-conductance mechanosensitive channel
LQVSLAPYDFYHLSFSWTRPLKDVRLANDKAYVKQLRKSTIILFQFLLVLSWMLFGRPLSGGAQTLPTLPKAESKGMDAWTAEKVAQLISEVDAALEDTRQAENHQTARSPGVDPEALRAYARRLIELKAVYGELSAEIGKEKELSKEAAAVREESNAFEQRRLLQKPPYMLSFFDDYMVEFDSLQQAFEIADTALTAARQNLEEDQLRLDTARQRLRSFKDKTGGEADPAVSWQTEDLEHDIKMADAMGRLQQRRVENLQMEKQLTADRIALVRKQIQWINSRLAYSEEDLKRHVDNLERRKNDLQKHLAAWLEKKKDADQKWLKVQAKVQAAVYADDLARAQSELKAADLWRKTFQTAADQTVDMVRLAGQQVQIWENRYAMLKDAIERRTLLQWREESDRRLRHISRIINVEQERQNSLWRQISALDVIPAEPGSKKKQSEDQNTIAALKQTAALRLDYIVMLTASQRLEHRLRDEIDNKLERAPIRYSTEKIWTQLRGIWNYEVWVIDNRPLTVKKIVVVLVILIVGIALARMLVRRLARRVLHRPQIKATTAATIEKLLLYSAYLLVVLYALRMINIPLAAFAFLGGAVAIGVGFGAQNLINNFISGFIIMGEQPISIGDLIEIDGVLGQVEEIGARCTQIRTGDNIHILVPNSSFLEKNITNWTLSDRIVRAHVTVGVVYGSPVEQVRQLLLQACRQLNKIHKDPEPFVLFNDFGDNALIFEVHFWISVQRIIERRMIESNLRFLIDECFRKANIVIAFPQRDIHLDSAEPLKIKLMPRDGTDIQNRR